MAEEVLVKATPVQAVLDYMDEFLTPEQRETVFAATEREYPEPARKARGRQILAFERFPVPFATQLVEGTAAVLHEPAADVAHRIGRRGAEAAAGGVLRLALTMISIPSLLRKLVPVWTQLYTHGRMTTTNGDHEGHIELHDFPLVSATLCARVTGWFSWFAEKAEKTARVEHVTCRAHGDDACRWQVRW